VGIGGVGMSGLARLLMQQGHTVSGSDLSRNGETVQLRELGAKIHAGHAARHLPADVELIVRTSAVADDNEELQAARERGVPVVRRGILLGAMMNHRQNIAVAGAHGKTTTSAMIALLLTRSDSAPSWCVGAHVPCLGANAQSGAGKYFVAEADESDGTLIAYAPEYTVCLNIEAEHLDFHGSMDALKRSYSDLFQRTLRTVFYCADCPVSSELAAGLRSAISFGLSDRADYRAASIEATERGARFDVYCRDQKMGTVELPVPGKQNVVNALAAIAVADEAAVPFVKIAEALALFTGAKRRFERAYEGGGVVVVDDYAHHPTEIRATLAAARSLQREGRPAFERVIVAFQPHRYTRTKLLRDDFATAFADADVLYLTDIYPASEPPLEGVTGQTLVEAVTATGQKPVTYVAALEGLADQLTAAARPGDLIIVMGAGDIYKVTESLTSKLPARMRHPVASSRSVVNMERDIRRLLSEGSRVARDEPMSQHTTIRVGGPAEYWVEPFDDNDLVKLLKFCHERELPVTVIGRGSNLLVRDGGIRGVVIHLVSPEFSKIKVDGERLLVSAGAPLRGLVNQARDHGIGGLEFLEGIPGSLGGALRMNAGAMGRQTFEVVEWVRYVSYSGQVYDTAARALPVAYRSCPTFANHVALSAIVRGQLMDRDQIVERLRTFERKRWESQPNRPSAGCIFKNPPAIAAGKLIDELGLKGANVGRAIVSEKHGNFIVNEGGATAADVLGLIALIQKRAKEARGIELEPEVMILGSDGGKAK
jgi:UDP-N-acetylmuramate--L-alanine ligase/UDP-N-acetylenolpyruvoylglucosamine reductase